jgi:DNA-binding response OmpR family regulator
MEREHRQSPRVSVPRVGRVVIVDDDPVCVAALERAFGRQGLQTISFEDGTKAWQGIQASPDVSLAVVNWMLPGLDGHRICQWLAQQRPDVTTVLLVSRRFLLEAWAKLRVRADYVLAKPLPQVGLDEQVRGLVAAAYGPRVASVHGLPNGDPWEFADSALTSTGGGVRAVSPPLAKVGRRPACARAAARSGSA